LRCDRPRRIRSIVDLHHRLVERWIERRTEHLDLSNTETLERTHQRALSADTFEQHRILDRLWRMTLAGGDGALQIVGDREKLAREICNGILAHILHRSLGAAPGVLGIRHALCGISTSCNCPPALPGYWFDNCWWPQLVASGSLSQFAVVDGELGQRNDVRALAPPRTAPSGSERSAVAWRGTFSL
jgi:hypothetical protein